MKVHNMTSERSGREVANQFVIEDKENVFFQSYDSMICKVDHANRTISFGSDWDYSRTTSKYLHKFLYDELCWSPCKADIQKAIDSGFVMLHGREYKVFYDVTL